MTPENYRSVLGERVGSGYLIIDLSWNIDTLEILDWCRAQDVRFVMVDEFIKWCDERGDDPEDARAAYAADRYRLGRAIDWPPGQRAALMRLRS